MNYFSRLRSTIILLMLLAASCSVSSDDDSDSDSPPSDDTLAADDTSDDAADDSASGDDSISDDSGDDAADDSADDVTDDTTDDTSDDSADDTAQADDTADDDTESLPDVCEDPSPGTDDCSIKMRTLYCEFGFPIITDTDVFTQTDAVANCRTAAEPLWIDLAECLQYMGIYEEFFSPMYFFTQAVKCLEEKGWPPTHTEIFDSSDWAPEIGMSGPSYSALNFWSWYMGGFYFFGDLSGAITRLTQPQLRAFETVISGDSVGAIWSIIGDDVLWSDTKVKFHVHGYELFIGFEDLESGFVDENRTLLISAK